jgi:hypothetical protein
VDFFNGYDVWCVVYGVWCDSNSNDVRSIFGEIWPIRRNYANFDVNIYY